MQTARSNAYKALENKKRLETAFILIGEIYAAAREEKFVVNEFEQKLVYSLAIDSSKSQKYKLLPRLTS